MRIFHCSSTSSPSITNVSARFWSLNWCMKTPLFGSDNLLYFVILQFFPWTHIIKVCKNVTNARRRIKNYIVTKNWLFEVMLPAFKLKLRNFQQRIFQRNDVANRIRTSGNTRGTQTNSQQFRYSECLQGGHGHFSLHLPNNIQALCSFDRGLNVCSDRENAGTRCGDWDRWIGVQESPSF